MEDKPQTKRARGGTKMAWLFKDEDEMLMYQSRRVSKPVTKLQDEQQMELEGDVDMKDKSDDEGEKVEKRIGRRLVKREQAPPLVLNEDDDDSDVTNEMSSEDEEMAEEPIIPAVVRRGSKSSSTNNTPKPSPKMAPAKPSPRLGPKGSASAKSSPKLESAKSSPKLAPAKPAPAPAKKRAGRPKKKVVEESESEPSDSEPSEHESDRISEDDRSGNSADEISADESSADEGGSSKPKVTKNVDDDLKFIDVAERLKRDYTVERILNMRISHDADHKEELLVKWKGLAYIHASWVDSVALQATKSGKLRYQRYITKRASSDDEDLSYLEMSEVERILDSRQDPLGQTTYFVKWKAQSYLACTWESGADIGDDASIERYATYNTPPPAKDLVEPPRPAASSFKELAAPDYFKEGNSLRPYQLEGLNWLSYCWHNRRNSILGDEMGLGKTVQSVSIIETLRKKHGIRGPFLCVAPLTTIPHWKREFEAWTDQNVLVYHDHGAARPIIRDHEFYYPSANGKKLTKFNTLITTYEMIISDRAHLGKIHWKYLVIDEAHRLKNKSCRLTTELRTYKFDHLLLLTGTPLQNNTQELWSLLNFMEPDTFASVEEFLEQYGDLKEAEQVAGLQNVLKPYILRRMKENVEKSIAPKEETIVEVELTTIQKKYYRAIYERNFGFLRKGGKGTGPSLLNIMMELRKCCNHPYLIKGAEDSETAGLPRGSDQVYERLIQASGKLVLIDKLLPKLKAGNHKVLIFSQMVAVLDILDDYLTYRGYIHERIDGSIKGNDRQAAIDRFSKPDSDRFVFLLCTRAGGIGINLTAADTVIIFDSDWNPQNDLQAQARCHRIGQQKPVKIYRLVTRNTYERLMFDRASKKLGLDRAVLTKMNTSQGAGEELPDKETIDSLLKYGVYAIKDDDAASERFYEEDIDKILDRSSTIVKQEVIDPLASSFSTASFCSSSSVPHIDVNDPNFWDKFVPELDTGTDLIMMPRTRKNVQRFNGLNFSNGGTSNSHGSTSTTTTNEQDDGESSDTEQSDFESGEEDEIAVRGGAWTVGERNRFKAALFTFGSGRWALVRAIAGLDRWTVDQVRQYGEAFVSKSLDIPIRAEPGQPSVEGLDAYVCHHEPGVFNLYNKEMPADETASTTAPMADDTPRPNPFVGDASFSDARFQEYLTRNAKKISQKLSNMSMLGQVLRMGYPTLVEGVGGLQGTPAPWWGLTEDTDLLIGSYRFGFGEYDRIREDKNLCFAAHSYALSPDSAIAAVQNPNTTTDRMWPNAKVLSHRFRRIMRTLEAFKKSQLNDGTAARPIIKRGVGNGNNNSADNRAKLAEERKLKSSVRVEWTKREKADFYKYLVIYGVNEVSPDEYSWDLIKEKANLKKKTSELIERYYFELLSKCQSAIADNAPGVTIDNKRPLNASSANLGAVDDEEPKDGILSLPQCRRLVNRVFFFKKLRTLLQKPNLIDMLGNYPPPTCFPQWWKIEFDVALLQGIARHGFGQYEEICQDKSLPFYALYKRMLNLDISSEDENPLSLESLEKKRKRKESILDVIGFPKDKPVSKRIEQTVEYMLNPTKVLTSSTSLANTFQQQPHHRSSKNAGQYEIKSSGDTLITNFFNHHSTTGGSGSSTSQSLRASTGGIDTRYGNANAGLNSEISMAIDNTLKANMGRPSSKSTKSFNHRGSPSMSSTKSALSQSTSSSNSGSFFNNNASLDDQLASFINNNSHKKPQKSITDYFIPSARFKMAASGQDVDFDSDEDEEILNKINNSREKKKSRKSLRSSTSGTSSSGSNTPVKRTPDLPPHNEFFNTLLNASNEEALMMPAFQLNNPLPDINNTPMKIDPTAHYYHLNQ
eukprot:gene15297-18116_t